MLWGILFTLESLVKLGCSQQSSIDITVAYPCYWCVRVKSMCDKTLSWWVDFGFAESQVLCSLSWALCPFTAGTVLHCYQFSAYYLLGDNVFQCTIASQFCHSGEQAIYFYCFCSCLTDHVPVASQEVSQTLCCFGALGGFILQLFYTFSPLWEQLFHKGSMIL